jgi:hypothetical protein
MVSAAPILFGPPKDGIYGKNEFNYKFRQMELE